MDTVSERMPRSDECKKGKGEFIVCTDMGEQFSCGFDALSNGYDNPMWMCNHVVVAWMPLPEPYKEGK